MQQLTRKVKNMCRQGKTLYKVYHLDSDQTFIDTLMISEGPTLQQLGSIGPSWFCNEGGVHSFSLQDCNIIPNTYNRHKVFSSLKKAVSHAKTIDPNFRYYPNKFVKYREGI